MRSLNTIAAVTIGLLALAATAHPAFAGGATTSDPAPVSPTPATAGNTGSGTYLGPATRW